jgi:hypothetical protein
LLSQFVAFISLPYLHPFLRIPRFVSVIASSVSMYTLQAGLIESVELNGRWGERGKEGGGMLAGVNSGGWPTQDLQLSGHLFDTGLINQVRECERVVDDGVLVLGVSIVFLWQRWR